VTYKIAEGDLGAILRVRETASNAGGESTVWSARYVGPVLSGQAAAAVLTRSATPVRNAQGSTLAVARRSKAKVSLRRPAKVKGRLAAWACPAAIGDGATPPPCSARVSLRKSAKLRLPASMTGKVRVVVVRR
jgi:hypothetical protein